MIKKVLIKLWPFLRLITGVALITWLLVRFDYGKALGSLQFVDPLLFTISAILFLLPALIVQPYKFYWLVNIFQRHRLTRIIQLSLVGYFFNQLLPSSVGGDVVKISMLREKTVPWSKYLYAALLDRFSGAAVLLVGLILYVLFFGMPVDIKWSTIEGSTAVMIGAVMLVAIGLATLIFFKPLKKKVISVWDSIRFLKSRHWMQLGPWAALAHVCYWLATWLLIRSFGIEIPVFDAFFVLAFSAFAASLPITVGGMGVREGIMIWTSDPNGRTG